jgi:hypothetical protein
MKGYTVHCKYSELVTFRRKIKGVAMQTASSSPPKKIKPDTGSTLNNCAIN